MAHINLTQLCAETDWHLATAEKNIARAANLSQGEAAALASFIFAEHCDALGGVVDRRAEDDLLPGQWERLFMAPPPKHPDDEQEWLFE